MNIGQLKAFIKEKNLPDDMPIGLLDLSTDDYTDGNYSITNENLLIEDYVKEEDGDVKGKMLFITFENSLNPNPI
jgi:hypothetical protein